VLKLSPEKLVQFTVLNAGLAFVKFRGFAPGIYKPKSLFKGVWEAPWKPQVHKGAPKK